MKNTLRIFSFAMVLVLALSVLTACELPDVQSLFSGEVTVTWYEGTKVHREEVVKKGTVLTPWTPKSPLGGTFINWYADPGCIEIFDFTQPITKNTEIYASFKRTGSSGGSGEYVMPDYYLVGSGLGDLKASAWNEKEPPMSLGLQDMGGGIYSIDVIIYAGDSFQICHDGSWDGQVGASNLVGIDENNEVKDANGNVVFYAGGQFGTDITLAEGQDGKYEITYDSINNSVSFKLIEKLEPNPNAGADAADMRFIGTFNDWQTSSYGENDYKLTLSEDGKTWVGTIEITADMYRDWTVNEGYTTEPHAALKLYNLTTGDWVSVKDGDNAFLKEGTYHISYENGAKHFVVWADGEEGPSTPDTPGELANTVYLVPNDAWKADDSFYGVWCWGDSVTGVFALISDANDDGIYEYEIPEGCNYIIFVDMIPGATDIGNEWVNKREQTSNLSVPTDSNVYYHVSVGNWGTAEGAEKPAVTEGVWTVAGVDGLCGTAWDVGNTDNDMVLDEAQGLYVKEYTNVAKGEYELKVAKDHSWNVSYGPNGGSANYKFTVATDGSTVVVTFDPNTNNVNVIVK